MINKYKNNQYILYKFEDIFLDIFCFCLNNEKNLDDIVFEINFDFNIFILEHHKYLIKKIYKDSQEVNNEYEKIYIEYEQFYLKYKKHYNKKNEHLKKMLEYIDISEKIN